MPELPEVETVRTILEGIVRGKTIAKIEVFRAKNILTGAEAFVRSLTGETFLSVSRKGKYLIFHLSHDKVVISHLRMEGKYFEKKESDPIDKFDLVSYDFTDGSALRYNDVRKFGVLLLSDEAHYLKEEPLVHLGKEPWDLTKEELYQGLQKKKGQTIKEALLDQSLIAGLGNIYDDETLYAAKISPLKKANKITLSECETLLEESRRILSIAVKKGGSTIRSYHPQEGVDGLMQNDLLAYGKGNTPCSRCGFPLRKITIGGRGTVYCPICQHLPGTPLILGVTGPIASGKSTVTAYLVNKGYLKLDADAIVEALYQEPRIIARIGRLLGKEVISAGKLDHAKMLEILAKTPSKKKKLEKLIHPLVYREIEKRLSKLGESKVVLDVPLLIGSPLEEKCDLILYIAASEKTQIARLVERGKDPKKSLALNHSYPRGKAKNAAGIVLNGDGSVASLIHELDKYKFL
jgi:formamidopyrimidine-DNA glycosylase